MPPLEETDLNQTIVVWPKVGNNSFGDPIVGVPIEMPCRFLEVYTESPAPQTTEEKRDATVIVLDPVARGSLVWPGALEDIPGTGTSAADIPSSQIYVVLTYNSTPDLKNRFQRRTLSLMRYRDSAVTHG